MLLPEWVTWPSLCQAKSHIQYTVDKQKSRRSNVKRKERKRKPAKFKY